MEIFYNCCIYVRLFGRALHLHTYGARVGGQVGCDDAHKCIVVCQWRAVAM